MTRNRAEFFCCVVSCCYARPDLLRHGSSSGSKAGRLIVGLVVHML